MFWDRLNLQANMACKDVNLSLSQFISNAIRLGNLRHLQPPQACRNTYFLMKTFTTTPSPCSWVRHGCPPKNISGTGGCDYAFIAGNKDTALATCPRKPGQSTTKMISFLDSLNLLLPVHLCYASLTHSLSALVESGSPDNLIHNQIVRDLHLLSVPCATPLKVTLCKQSAHRRRIYHASNCFNNPSGGTVPCGLWSPFPFTLSS